MKGFKKLLCLGLSLTMIGGGISKNAEKKVEAGSETILIDGSVLKTDHANSSSKLTSLETLTYSNLGINFYATSACYYIGSNGNNKFSNDAILIGKSGSYIYNKDAFPGNITSFKIYANKGGSAKVSVGLNFSDSLISSYNSTADYKYIATLSSADSVYDCSSSLSASCKYFWFQVTSSNNAQVQFQIVYDKGTSEPSITMSGNSDVMVGISSNYSQTNEDFTNPAITWTSSDENIAIISEEGVLTPKKMGKATISVTATDLSNTKTDSKEITVWPSNSSAISISDALEIAEFAGTTNSYFKYKSIGTIKSIDGYNLVLTDGTNDITCYSKAIPSSAVVGDKIAVEGYLKNYVNTGVDPNTETLEYTSVTFTQFYNVNFRYDDTDHITEYTKGDKLVKPTDPIADDGYIFFGWRDSSGNIWDFENDEVAGTVTLTPDFVPSTIYSALNDATTKKSIGYQFERTTSTSTDFVKITATNQIHAGNVVMISSTVGESEYFASNTIDSNGLKNNSYIAATSSKESYLESETTSFSKWIVEDGTADGTFALKTPSDPGQYLKTNNGDLSLVDEKTSACDFYVQSNGTSFYFGKLVGTNDRCLLGRCYENNDAEINIFKFYVSSSIGSNEYASSTAIYVQGESKSYTDVDFRVRCGITGYSVLNSSVTGVSDECGIKLTIETDSDIVKTRYYNFKVDNSHGTDDDVDYKVIKLGDILNNTSRITDTFTFSAYAKVDGIYYTPTTVDTFTVKSLLETYYNNTDTKDYVSDLCEAIEYQGVNLDLND